MNTGNEPLIIIHVQLYVPTREVNESTAVQYSCMHTRTFVIVKNKESLFRWLGNLLRDKQQRLDREAAKAYV